MKTIEQKITEIEAQGIDVSPYGAAWLLQKGQRHLRVADLRHIPHSDIDYLAGRSRTQASESRYRDLAKVL